MTCNQFDALLPLLMEGESEVTPSVREHLDGCDRCRSLFSDLNAIRHEARGLAALTPERDLWAGIEARIEAPVVPLANGARRTPMSLSWRTAGMAAAALVVMTSAITYGIARRHGVAVSATVADLPFRPQPRGSDIAKTGSAMNGSQPISTQPAAAPALAQTRTPVTSSSRSPSPATVALATSQSAAPVASASYDREMAQLRAVLDKGRTRLDPATVALLDRNLGVIDSAIAQCQRALVKDPASQFLIESLDNSYQTKVKLLRIAAAAASKG